MKKVRVLLADVHPHVLEKVTQLLEPEYEIVGTASDGGSLVNAATRLEPDVLVIDVIMPVLDGIQAANNVEGRGMRLENRFPNCACGPRLRSSLPRDRRVWIRR